jgi:hypothetical protein
MLNVNAISIYYSNRSCIDASQYTTLQVNYIKISIYMINKCKSQKN